MKRNFVFDIDGALAIAIDLKPVAKEKNKIAEKFGKEFEEAHCIEAAKYPHHVFPGYYALLRWLHSLEANIFFFSSGLEIRNVEFAEKLMKNAFGDKFSEVPYKVYSRKHCIDTEDMPKEEGEKFQSYFFGNRKKKLAGVVVPEKDLENTLLIDDDNSYMVKGEEYNFVYLKFGGFDYLPHNIHDLDILTKFHKAYYLAGLFNKIFEVQKEKNISLVKAAKYVQIDMEGAELNRNFYYPGVKRIAYYEKGLEILKQFDPELKFYYEITEHVKQYLIFD